MFQLLEHIELNMMKEHVVILMSNKDNPNNSSTLLVQQSCG
jgi:hypothetical protein